MFATNNLSQIESQAMTALAVGGQIANLLAPSAATSAAVSDILSAAGDVVQIVNTANAVLSTFTSAINDPITSAFSTGQPYGGTFITTPTITQILPVNFDQALRTSTQALSQISPPQITALSAQTGTMITNDADLATAMGISFSNTTNTFKIPFSSNLSDSSTITPYTTASTIIPQTIVIPPITAQPNISMLSSFVSSVAPSFPNTPGIAGVASSVWVDHLGSATSNTGTPVTGVPSSISTGVYSDITSMASQHVALTPTSVVDYSDQQNTFNTTVALAIDNGLVSVLSDLLSSSMVTDETRQVMINRLDSVSRRGDVTMLNYMVTYLNSYTTIPNDESLVATTMSNLRPSDETKMTSPQNTSFYNSALGTTNSGYYTGVAGGLSTFPTPVSPMAQSGVTSTSPIASVPDPLPIVTASGIPITTTTTPLTASQLTNQISTLLTTLGRTPQQIFSQNTGGSVFNGQPLLNASLIRQSNQTVTQSLLDPTTTQMAMMF